MSLDQICNLSDRLDAASPALRQACSRPRSTADLSPLPEPHLDGAFDSSWQALLGDDGPPDPAAS